MTTMQEQTMNQIPDAISCKTSNGMVSVRPGTAFVSPASEFQQCHVSAASSTSILSAAITHAQGILRIVTPYSSATRAVATATPGLGRRLAI